MRILVLQLARFGDIYQSWPALKALKRVHPEAEIHLLVRHRFWEATQGLDGIQVHTWPTAELLGPIYEEGDERAALRQLEKVIAPLCELKCDRVINLSFSPMSSWLASLVAPESAEVSGYTRFEDGYLNIPDDASAYFFAQGEIGKHNRYHVTQIFALVAGVDLIEEDFHALPATPSRKDEVIVHLGASQAQRLYPAELWIDALKAAAAQGGRWILIGSPDERGLAETVCAQVNLTNVVNEVGGTRWPELIRRLSQAKLFIGGDSAPAQCASLTQTPVLQLTSKAANFWTTGPTSAGSRVLYAEELSSIEPRRIAEEACAMLKGLGPKGPCATRSSALAPYHLHELEFDQFPWALIEAIYTQTDYPAAETEADFLSFQRLFEVSELALEQLENFLVPEKQRSAALILKNVDELIQQVALLNPRIEPLIGWFETERLRIPPGSAEDTLARTKKLFVDLRTISLVYRRYDEPDIENRRAVELAKRCLPAIREFRIASVQDDFQSLLSTLHELSRHSTKVGEGPWSAMLGGLNEALNRRDMIEVADQLEYVLIPALS